jgi:integral membrane sensor domain MASE1
VSVAVRGFASRNLVPHALRSVGVAVAYFLTAKLGLLLAVVGGQVTPLWPPTGLVLACLILHGPTCWPGITVGAFLANLALGPTVPAVVIISIGNTLAPLLAWYLLSRVGFRLQLDRLRDAVSLVFLGALLPMLVSATVGAVTLLVSGEVRGAGFWGAWVVWWAGDAMGVLVTTPVLLVARMARWTFRASPRRWLEAAALPIAAIAVIATAKFTSIPLFFTAFPVVVWAALRFQLRGAAPVALLVSTLASIGAVRGAGPFAQLNLVEKMVTLHAFNASVALTALLLAAVTTERKEALHAVERAVARLSDAVQDLEPYRALRGGLLDGVPHVRASKDPEVIG